MLRLAIFDVDGTLVDSQAAILAAMKGAHAAVGLPLPPRENLLGIVGLSLPQAMAALHPERETAAHHGLAEAYRQAFKALRAAGGGETDVPFYPGAREALARLDKAGWLLAVATGKARRGLNHLLEIHGLEHLFVATQSADDAPSKPHPGMVENILRATGVEATRAVMIGDTAFDMAMGRAAGAGAIGVSWGYHPVPRLYEAGAELVIEEFAALDDALESVVAEAPA
ncbi:MAG: HAD-IA family hydrolase [Pseudomonadota bacterium]